MKKLIYLTLIFSVIISSCRKPDEFSDGPDLYDVYGPFEIITPLEASQINVDFAAGETVFFNCGLSKVVDWQLKITGSNSGAEKIINGTSKYLNEEVALWDGTTTSLPIFSRYENCNVELSFLTDETDTILSTSVYVLEPKLNAGFVITDFEAGWDPNWSTFVQSGTSMAFGIRPVDPNIEADPAKAPQLARYYNMAGAVDWDWLTGMIDFNASAFGETVMPLSSNGDNLYFNAFVYGDPLYPNSRVLFRFDEDENIDGTFDVTSEDSFGYEIIIDWSGWRHISVKYSDILSANNSSGGGVHNPDKLNRVSVLHLADPNSGYAHSAIDYLIFTENEPLRP
ncbi:MAG: hypothetical protein CL850_05205 [Crocinitomicaceae bacterium]|nr:hypothetical protein [Crocinitomicaceae bacterium]|tara:strand:+ start:375 stop:1394 length:1020 start_codon:yes stop_codon:yes gene_type:complete